MLGGQHGVAISRVQLLGPQAGVRAPFLGREAEDLLDLRARVAPAAVGAGVGDVDDRRHPLEQVREGQIFGRVRVDGDRISGREATSDAMGPTIGHLYPNRCLGRRLASGYAPSPCGRLRMPISCG